MSKFDTLKVVMGMITHLKPIVSEINQIEGKQKHGKPEFIELKEKKLAVSVYKEYFETEADAKHFMNFCNQVYALKKDQLPPIHVLVSLFKALLPIMQPKELKGEQSHGKPELRKVECDDKFKYAVVLKEVFTNKKDAQEHIIESQYMQSLRL